MKREDYIDFAKGIGILIVVLGHASLVGLPVHFFIYSFHMPLFFVITGMLTAVTKAYDRPFKSVFLSRLRTIMLPYLIFSVIYTLIDYLELKLAPTDTKAFYFPLNIKDSLTLVGSGPLWFLPTLFISECIYIFLIRKKGFKIGNIIALVSAALGFAALCFIRTPYMDSRTLDDSRFLLLDPAFVIVRSIICLIFLAFGALLYRGFELLKERTHLKYPRILQAVLGVLLMTVTFFISIIPYITNPPFNDFMPQSVDMHYMYLVNPAYFLVCSLMGSTGLILLCKALCPLRSDDAGSTAGHRSVAVLSLCNRLIRFWGRNSLLIMVTHLNCYVLFLGRSFAMFVNPYITHAKTYIYMFNTMWSAMLIESLLILLVNRFCPQILGRPGHKAGEKKTS